jgi:hypothetical protein
MSKTIVIKKATIFKFLLSFILGFAILYGLEHYGNFSFLEEQTVNRNEKPSFTRDISLDANLNTIIYSTFFGNEIRTDGNGFQVKDIYFSSGIFHKYTNKSYYYTKSTIEDYKFGLYFGLGIFILLMFFTYVKIKIS